MCVYVCVVQCVCMSVCILTVTSDLDILCAGLRWLNPGHVWKSWSYVRVFGDRIKYQQLSAIYTESVHCWWSEARTHTQPFNSCWSGITRVGQYQEKHLPTHTHPGHRTSFISFFHLLRSIASLCSVYVLDSPLWQPLSRSSLVFLLVLGPLLHTPCIFFTQSSSSLCSTCPYYHSLFCCNTSAMPSIPSLSVSSLLGNLLVDWGKSE